MSRKFIALVVSTALAVAAVGNAPARADTDTVKLLAALAGAAIVGKVVMDRARQTGGNPIVTRDRTYDEQWLYGDRGNHASVRRYDSYQAPQDWRSYYGNKRGGYEVVRRVEPRPLPREVRRRLLPGECLRSYETREGRIRVFGRECLERSYSHVRDLPRACEVKLRLEDNKKRRGYDARCLRQEGYELARR